MNARISRLAATLVAAIVFAGGTSILAGAQACPTPNYTPDFSSNENCMMVNGSSVFVLGSPTVLQITSSTGNQVGSAWYITPQIVENGFSTSFQFQITNPSTPPADGIAFVIQNSSTTAIGYTGGNGGALGYGDADGNSNPSQGQGIPNSLAIEFDTFENSWDPPAVNGSVSHVAIQSCGVSPNTSHHNYLCQGTTGPNSTVGNSVVSTSNVADGGIHTVSIVYTPACSSCSPATLANFQVSLDGVALYPNGINVDLSTIGLGSGNTAYVGFTGATGGDWETQDILDWTFSQTIVQPVATTTPTTFNFSTPTTTLNHVVDFSEASDAGDLVYPLNDPSTILIQSTDTVVNPQTWPQYVTAGPLATSTMFALASDNPSGSGGNGSLFIDLCSDPTLGVSPSDANCPYSTSAASSDLLQIQISGSLVQPEPAINNPVNTGVTTVLAHYEPPSSTPTAPWSPSTINGTPNPACVNTLGTEGSLPPQNCNVLDIQQTFYGDPTVSGGTNHKGTFAMIYNVPMALSTVSANGTPLNIPPANSYTLPSNLWFSVLKSPVQLSFDVNPACPVNTWPCTIAPAQYNYFTAAPILGETYQVTNASGTVVYPASPPAQATPPSGFNTETVQPIIFTGQIPTSALPDGQYFMQWSAADNVGIQEQNVQYIVTGTCPNPAGGSPFSAPCYQTNLFQAPFNLDNTPPTISAISVTPNPATYGMPATATFSCNDPTAADGAAASGLASTSGCVQGVNSVAVNTSSVGPLTFTVTAIDNAGNATTASQQYSVNPALATITLGNLTQTYTGSPLSATATTNPAGLAVSLTYNGSPTAPTNAGHYAVVATITNPDYTGSTTGTLVISPAAATVTLSNLTQAYTGKPLSPTVTTSPSGLAYLLTGAPDTNVGSYAVTAAVTNANYAGSTSGTFVITGSTASVSPSSWNFGTLKNGRSACKTFTLSNTGNATMSISNIAISGGSDPDDFKQTNSCGKSLSAGKSCTITVTYTADKDDRYGITGDLVFTDNAAGSPQTVVLSGKSD